MLSMRALPKAESVCTPACVPLKLTASTPMALSAIASSPIETCSPVLATTSSSRGSGSGWISLASAIRRLVSPLMAETTTTIW